VFFPTYHSIGYRIYFSGDDDSTNSVQVLVKRTGAAAFDTCPPPVRISDQDMGAMPRRLWAGSALWCGSDSNYTFHVVVSDAAGCTGCTPADPTVQTWAPPNIGVVGKQ